VTAAARISKEEGVGVGVSGKRRKTWRKNRAKPFSSPHVGEGL
jgi:hypothetical protein